jgi:hypothetical protein
MKPKFFLIVMGLMLLLFSYSSAQVPQMINYQRKLTKSSGALLDTTISMVFSIYLDPINQIPLWTETQTAVSVEKGIFNVLLGSVNPIPDSVFDGTTRYLGVKIGADPEISPRKPMVSVPYAYTDGDWTKDANYIYRLQGNIGIGTSSPGAKLEVRGDIKLHTDGSLYVPGGVENLRIIRGSIADCSIIAGSGFSVYCPGNYQIIINFSTPFTSLPSVIVSVRGSAPPGDPLPWFNVVNVETVSIDSFMVRTRSQQMGTTYGGQSCDWDFIAIGPR